MKCNPQTGQRLAEVPQGAPTLTFEQWRVSNDSAKVLYNPWTGVQRKVLDIESDPFGMLLVEPSAPLIAAPPPYIAPPAGELMAAAPPYIRQDDRRRENSGGKVNYYRVEIKHPNQAEEVYTAECSDIIEALGMTFNEGEEFKALWRGAAQRTLGIGKRDNEYLRDAEKRAHYASRDLVIAKATAK